MQSLSAEEDRPFYMLNLIKYREKAVHPDGWATDLNGREANQLYNPMEFFPRAEHRAKLLFTVSRSRTPSSWIRYCTDTVYPKGQ